MKQNFFRAKILFFLSVFVVGFHAQAPDSVVAVAKSATVQVPSDSVSVSSGGKVAIMQPNQWKFGLAKIFWSVFALIVGYLVNTFLTVLLESLAEKIPRFRLGIKRYIPLVRIAVWTLTLYLIIAKILAPPIATLLAFTASAGIAIGFAVQDLLKNIIGGIMIQFDRPFQVGDKIQVGDHYGEVISIGLRTVRIVTPDDSVISIPNAEIVNHSVSNANSGENNCQVVAELYLPPYLDIATVKDIAYEVAATSRYVYLGKPISVMVKNEMKANLSWLKVRIKAYVLDIRYEFKFASDMTETMIGELIRRGLVTREDFEPANR